MPAPLAPISDNPVTGAGTVGIEQRMLRYQEQSDAPEQPAAASDKVEAPEQPAEEQVEEKVEEQAPIEEPPAEEQPPESEGVVSIPRAEYDDLKAGTLRHADYTQKTQALATERTAVEQARTELRAVLDKEQQTLDAAKQWLQASMPQQEPDWQDLAQKVSDAEFTRQYAAYAQQKEKLNALDGKLRTIAEQRARDAQAEFQKYVAAQEQKLMERVPDWKDQAKARTEMGTIVTYVKQAFPETTDQELAQVVDHRWWVLANKARLYDAAMAAKPKVTRQAATPTLARPGAHGPPPPKPRPEDAHRQRLAATGDVKDATRLFEDLLVQGRL